MLDPHKNIIAATPFCFPGYHPFTAYRLFSKAGIYNVEIPALSFKMSADYEMVSIPPELMNHENLIVLREFLQQHRLTPITMAVFSDFLESREVESLRICVDAAQKLGVQYLITDATRKEKLDRNQWEKLIKTMRNFADYAADSNIRVTLEIHKGPTQTGELALKLLESVNHPNIGINYDTGNIYYYNEDIDPAEDIKHIAEYVMHVHLKDTTGGKGEWKFCALGEGRVNFPEIIQVLQSVNFRGPYSLELEGKEGEDLNRQKCLRRLEKSLNYLRDIRLLPSIKE